MNQIHTSLQSLGVYLCFYYEKALVKYSFIKVKEGKWQESTYVASHHIKHNQKIRLQSQAIIVLVLQLRYKKIVLNGLL